MAGLSQMSGSSAARTVENTINSTTYTTVGDPYPQSNKDKYPLARGKQFGTGTAQASGTIDGAIGTVGHVPRYFCRGHYAPLYSFLNPCATADRTSGFILQMSQSHITIGTPYIQGGHSPAKESGLYERCAGKQFETVGPKYGSPGQGATDALIKPLGFVTVGDPYDDRLRSMPWKGSQDYTRNIQCERLREQLKKDRRTAGRPLQFEFVAAQGLPTLSLRRESSGARRLSAEQSFEAERERSKLLQKFPRYAKALSPDRLKPRPTPYIGPDAGPQLLGRKGPNSDENPLPYSPTLSPSPEALRTAKRLSGLPG
eukprot:SAG31_NODE_2220_length_6157_cov_4.078244_8_plen_314_part_00